MQEKTPRKIPRELTWGIVASASLWLLTNLKSGVLMVIFSGAAIVCAVYTYGRLRKKEISAAKAAAVVVIANVVFIFLGMGAHALVDALTKHGA